MGANTKIEWATHTFNAWRGCEKIAPGCDNCYAAAFAKRNPKMLGEWGPSGTRIVASEAMWQQPLKWNKEAEKREVLHDRHPELEPYARPRVFCNSIADVFEDWHGPIVDHIGNKLRRSEDGRITDCVDWTVPLTLKDLRTRLFSKIDETQYLDWLLLTKRPENIKQFWPLESINGTDFYGQRMRTNVWLGTSIACQADADRNIPELLKCRDLAPVLFLSIEPLVAPVDLVPYLFINDPTGAPADLIPRRGNFTPAIDGVFVGGESGPNARPMNPDWVRLIRDQCQAAGVAFFFKQWGEWMPTFHGIDPTKGDPKCRIAAVHHLEGGQSMWKVGKAGAGRMLDGREWNELPEVQR